MVPKVEGPWDIHYVDRLLAQLEAKAGVQRPILIHALLETSLGVVNLEEIATASPRMQGMSFGPAHLAASRRMKTTRVGGAVAQHAANRFLQVDDVNQIALAENIRLHLRVPPAGPMAEMHAGIDQFLHGDCH